MFEQPSPVQNQVRGPAVVIDQFLHPDVFREVVAEIRSFKHWKPEYDHYDLEPVGMTCEIIPDMRTHKAMYEEVGKLFAAPWTQQRFFVNRFEPKEIPQFHRDGCSLTCLLYADDQELQLDDHGETQLLIGREIMGVLAEPNRLLVFDGNMMHRATSFQARQRHTVSLHVNGVGFSDIVLPS